MDARYALRSLSFVLPPFPKTARKYNVPDSIINRAETLCLAFDKICRGRETAQASDGSMTGQEEFLAKATVALHRGTKTRHDGKGGDHRNEGWQRLRTWTTGWWPNSGRGWDGDLFGGSKKMEEAARVGSRLYTSTSGSPMSVSGITDQRDRHERTGHMSDVFRLCSCLFLLFSPSILRSRHRLHIPCCVSSCISGVDRGISPGDANRHRLHRG